MFNTYLFDAANIIYIDVFTYISAMIFINQKNKKGRETSPPSE